MFIATSIIVSGVELGVFSPLGICAESSKVPEFLSSPVRRERNRCGPFEAAA